MINYKELRIGNIVSYDYPKPEGSKVMVVTSVDATKTDRHIRLLGEMINNTNRMAIGEYFNPVPLTREWLLKFGFEYHSDIDEWIKDSIKIFIDDENFFFERKSTGSMDVHIKYVHTLQNLFQVLTGEELNYTNLKKKSSIFSMKLLDFI